MSKRIRKRQYKKLHRHYISERQAFSLFSYQAQYIADGLRTFIRMERHSTGPSSVFTHFCKKHGVSSDGSGYEKNPEAFGAAEKEAIEYWEDILKRMYYAFDQIANDYPDSPHSVWFDKAYEEHVAAGKPTIIEKTVKNEDGTYTTSELDLPEAPESIWAAEREYRKKIAQGTRLYGRYFQELWD